MTRDERIVAALAGPPRRTLQQVADEFDLSRERIRQIAHEQEHGLRASAVSQRASIRRVFYAVGVVARMTSRDQHGTLTRYRKGCSCDACTAASRAHAYRYRPPKGEDKVGKTRGPRLERRTPETGYRQPPDWVG